MFGFLGAPNPATMTCSAIIKGFEKNTLLASPEGGRSSGHRKGHAKRVKELQPFYDDCVRGKEPQGSLDMAVEDQAVVDSVYGGQAPMSTRFPVTSGALGVSTPMLIALGVGGALLVTFLLTRRKT